MNKCIRIIVALIASTAIAVVAGCASGDSASIADTEVAVAPRMKPVVCSSLPGQDAPGHTVKGSKVAATITAANSPEKFRVESRNFNKDDGLIVVKSIDGKTNITTVVVYTAYGKSKDLRPLCFTNTSSRDTVIAVVPQNLLRVDFTEAGENRTGDKIQVLAAAQHRNVRARAPKSDSTTKKVSSDSGKTAKPQNGGTR